MAADFATNTLNMGKGDALNFAKVISATSGVLVGGGGENAAAVNIAGTTGANAAENNYLRHTEALRLSKLLDQQTAGKCDADCGQQIDDLKALDRARQQELQDCAGANSTKCNGARQDLRNAAAEYIRKSETINTRGATYAGQYLDTTEQAYASINGKANGVLSAVADMAKGFLEIVDLTNRAQIGDTSAMQTMVEQSKVVKEFLSDKDNLLTLVGIMSPAQKQTFATAVENNDGTTVGKMLTEQTMALANTISLTTTAVKLSAIGVTALKEAALLTSAKAAGSLDAAATSTLIKTGGAVDASGNAILDMSKLSNNQKGVMGDLFGQSTVNQIVPDGQKIARMPGVGETGLDDLYKVNRPDVDYVNIEYKFVADPKNPSKPTDLGSDRLKNTNDGLQGSQSWITGSDRIDKAVGVDQAIDVYKAAQANRVESWVVTTYQDGSTAVEVLDALGKPKPLDKSKIILPTNLSGAKP
jgi:hypothetical protein